MEAPVRWKMHVGRVKRIKAHPERVLYKCRDDPFHQGTVDLQAGVVVYFDQPGLKVPVYHEVQPKYLEIIGMALVVDGLVVGFDYSQCQFLHFGNDHLLKVVISARKGVVEVPLEFRVGELVAWLVFLESFALALNGIVGQVDIQVIEIVQVVVLAAGSQVSVFVPVCFDCSPDRSQQHVVPNVEFTPVVQERSVKVGLEDVSVGLTICMLASSHKPRHPIKSGQPDSDSPVGVLARLHNPYFFGVIFVFTNEPPILPVIDV